MNRIFLLCLAFLLSATTVFGQKIKHKKGEILVDKVPTFKFEKTSEKKQPFAYVMTTMEGDTMMKFSDRRMEYTQLPYEKSVRVETKYCYVEVPALGGKTASIMPITLGYGNFFTYGARKTEFLTPTGLDGEKWDAYLDYYDVENYAKKFEKVAAANAVRAENSVRSIALFGEFKPRGNGDVSRRDDDLFLAAVIIGKIRKPTLEELKADPGGNLQFLITTTFNDKVIAGIYGKKGSGAYSIRTKQDGKSADFDIFTSVTDVTADPYQHGLNYLVNHGYM